MPDGCDRSAGCQPTSGTRRATSQPASAARINDTGQIFCVNPVRGRTPIPCAGTGQDSETGRDVSVRVSRDGRAGFSFVKIGSDGAELPAAATEWACVKDRVTGLLWEEKTRDGDLRDLTHLYTNFGDGRPDDASALVGAVNDAGLCGARDWRLPERLELQTLVDYSRAYPGPTIDTRWFPNVNAWVHWTSTSHARVDTSAWVAYFQSGEVVTYDRGERYAVRLCAGSPLPGRPKSQMWLVAEDAEVRDTANSLVWRRCAEGQTWTGVECAGAAALFTWQSALAHANAQAAAYGLPWRVPNVKELSSIVADRRIAPSINPHLFPSTSAGDYWTSTYDNSYADRAWRITFQTGSIEGLYRDEGLMIRLVRDSPQAATLTR